MARNGLPVAGRGGAAARRPGRRDGGRGMGAKYCNPMMARTVGEPGAVGEAGRDAGAQRPAGATAKCAPTSSSSGEATASPRCARAVLT